MSHTTLVNHYSLIFALAQHHKYSINEINNLIPFERDLYVDMLLDYLERKKKEEENQ